MSTKQPKSNAADHRAIPYPSWSEIAAEVGSSCDASDAASKQAVGRSWYDLLGDDAAPEVSAPPECRERR